MIIEVDGADHKKKESVKHFDKMKDLIAAHYEVPLARLEAYNPIDIRQEMDKLFQYLNLSDPYKYPVYCHECGRRFSYQKKGTYGDFYFCKPCQQELGRNITLKNTPENCPPILRKQQIKNYLMSANKGDIK